MKLHWFKTLLWPFDWAVFFVNDLIGSLNVWRCREAEEGGVLQSVTSGFMVQVLAMLLRTNSSQTFNNSLKISYLSYLSF